MDEKLELTFDRLKEELEEVAKLYDAERLITTNRIRMKQTFAKIKDNQDYQLFKISRMCIHEWTYFFYAKIEQTANHYVV